MLEIRWPRVGSRSTSRSAGRLMKPAPPGSRVPDRSSCQYQPGLCPATTAPSSPGTRAPSASATASAAASRRPVYARRIVVGSVGLLARSWLTSDTSTVVAEHPVPALGGYPAPRKSTGQRLVEYVNSAGVIGWDIQDYSQVCRRRSPPLADVRRPPRRRAVSRRCEFGTPGPAGGDRLSSVNSGPRALPVKPW